MATSAENTDELLRDAQSKIDKAAIKGHLHRTMRPANSPNWPRLPTLPKPPTSRILFHRSKLKNPIMPKCIVGFFLTDCSASYFSAKAWKTFSFADDCLAIDKVGCLQLIIHVAYRLSVEINAVLPYEPSPLALRQDQFGFKQDIKQLQSVRKLLTADDCFGILSDRPVFSNRSSACLRAPSASSWPWTIVVTSMASRFWLR